MALDYVIALECPLKGRHGRKTLVNTLKHRMVLDLIRIYVDDPRVPALVPVASGAGHAEREQMAFDTAARIRPQVEALEAYRSDCLNCPASVFTDRDWPVGGCVGFLTLPIEAGLEAHWRDMLTDVKWGRPGAPSWLADLGHCARRSLSMWARLRKITTQGEPDFFERRAALTCARGALNGGVLVTTDAVCELLFRAPSERKRATAAASRFCQDFIERLSNRYPGMRLRQVRQASRSLDDFLDFAEACRLATELGLAIRTGSWTTL